MLYIGDHDPSGIDMTRDITERLETLRAPVQVERLALNMAQVEQNKLPPNPAKITDSRFKAYLQKFGRESWELDALEPRYLADLIKTHIEKYIDQDKRKAIIDKESSVISELSLLASRYRARREGESK